MPPRKEETNKAAEEEKEQVTISVRTAMMIALGAAFLTFVSQVGVDIASYYRYAAERERVEENILLKQAVFEQRISMIEQGRTVERQELAEQIEDISVGSNPFAVVRGEEAVFPIDNVLSSVVEIICLDNKNKDIFYTGSGTMVDRHGLLITNHHLLIGSDGSVIRFCGVGFTDSMENPPRTEFIAETVGVDSETDLAILQIIERLDGADVDGKFSYISMDGSLAATRGLTLGDVVYIAGYPGVGAQTFTFTQGVVSGRVGSDLIKTSALVDSGTSGGAAFDGYGNFIGIPTAAARGDIGGSLGYLIGADIVDRFLGDFYAGRLNMSVADGDVMPLQE
jgi:S1-C subfamily serine protease